MEKKKHICSRFICDVELTNSYIEVKDSSKNSYYIDVKNENVVSQFKEFFKNTFSKGIPQFLTVFEVSSHEVDGEIHLVIENFIHYLP